MSTALALGDFPSHLDHGCLDLDFCLGLQPSRRAWSEAAALADYFCDYFRSLLQTDRRAGDLGDSLGYAANELLENCIKYSPEGEIRASAGLVPGELALLISNPLERNQARRFKDQAQRLLAGDPATLLLERVEHNLNTGPSAGSGLGLLSLMADHGARLAWRFVPPQTSEAPWQVSVLVRFPLSPS